MNATEAREKAESIIQEKNDDQYEKIKKDVTASANNGSFEISFYHEIYSSVEKKLFSEGFIVSKPTYERDGEVIHKISW